MNSSKTKRLRIFAGPNGSGKTTIIRNISGRVSLGYYVNADDIELALKTIGSINFDSYGIIVSVEELKDFVQKSGFTMKRLVPDNLAENLKVSNNILSVGTVIVDSYLAADLADFIRHKLLEHGHSFSFETVLSHPSKHDFLKKAAAAGYKIYLYFVATESPEININRVNLRVVKNGHHVDEQKIRERYVRSLDLLMGSVVLSDQAYIFDNSGEYYKLVAEVTHGRNVEMVVEGTQIPEWFIQYFYRKAVK